MQSPCQLQSGVPLEPNLQCALQTRRFQLLELLHTRRSSLNVCYLLSDG